VKYYFDTSFIIAVIIDEARSASARLWWNNVSPEAIVSDFASVEFCAVVSRGVRTKALTEAGARLALDDFDLMRATCGSHVHGGADFDLAARLVRDFSTKLAAPDALHLASAVNIDATLVTYDARLAEAARLRSVGVVAPG
jgi:predicted nucleic acid-binding protein